jgi:predicted ABC-type ATPase
MDKATPRVIVLAGSNGAGKTTASRTLLAETLKTLTFVNADVIAQGLAGFNPESAAFQAGRLMLQRMKELADARQNFAFETTLAARHYAVWLKKLKETGYEVDLYYFWLDSADLAVSRVALRVQQGGHHIPEDTIRQRYSRSIWNFLNLYKPVATKWEVYDNSKDSNPQLVANGDESGMLVIENASGWEKFNKAGGQ